MSVYRPLEQHLVKAAPARITFSFAEIERLLGRRLPPSAYDDKIKRQWWANTDTHSQARAWLNAGRKAKLDAAKNEVTFIAMADRPVLPEIGAIQLSPAARQLIRDIVDETGLSESEAIIEALNQAARARRRAALAWFEEHARPTQSSSVDLIREDRDGR